MLEYAYAKEERLSEFRFGNVVEPSFLIDYLPPKACKGGMKRLEEIRKSNDWELLLESFTRSRIIRAIIKAGYSFYTDELQRKRSALYREHYGLICEAVSRVSGFLSEDFVSEATVAFLEALDNIVPGKLNGAKPTTYVFAHIVSRLKEFCTSKSGLTVYTYLKKLCGYENASELLEQGLVRVNGRVVRKPSWKVSLTDEILVGDERAASPSSCLGEPSTPASQEEELLSSDFWRVIRGTVGDVGAEALAMYANGFSFREIAEELGLSIWQVSEFIRKARRERSLEELLE
ncbi:RNA polymerase sigma factor, sigma-70 family (plasmid) [Thermovibrio ammonificans HB-1]|uniref:RNA polymerase sigma factor, sigma-70 family n=1 Tax=Thermovibrio ammonificans (strain DSM 15698 / JCM 12110 / HB-1) TaxID=648996 RepID=E8T6X1_THEA1|nr:S4 domain-containing protein [Thermovibrio ammonificans]ADU97692.1 RNA polymerase sigma factor, sigma-70 family [Thermovibrio ammonificans HB-1]